MNLSGKEGNERKLSYMYLIQYTLTLIYTYVCSLVTIEKAAIVCSITEERTKQFSDTLGDEKNLSDPHQNAEVS